MVRITGLISLQDLSWQQRNDNFWIQMDRANQSQEVPLDRTQTTKDYVKSLKVIKYSTKTCQHENCCICYVNYKKNEKLRQLECKQEGQNETKQYKHVFHEECLSLWFNKKRECPLCRTSYEQEYTLYL